MKKLHKKMLLAFLFLILMFELVLLFDHKQDEIEVFFSDSIYSIVNLKQASTIEEVKTLNESDWIDTKSPAKSVPVIVYHGVVEKSDGFNVLKKDFESQMRALKEDGWETVSVEDFNAFIRGEKRLPDKSFLLTFDDGRKDSYYNADPILKELNYSAVMFVITGESLNPLEQNSKFHLNKRELKKMQNSGRWELQAHAKNGHGTIAIDKKGNQGYFYSNKMWLNNENRIETEEEYRQRVYNDIKGTKDDLESTFGNKVTAFAYPFGDFGKDSINFPDSKEILTNITGELFETSYYQTWVGLGYTYNYPFEEKTLIKRIEPNYDWNGERLLSYLEFGREKELPYDSVISGFDGWVENTGFVKDSRNTLTMTSDPELFVGFAVFDGTKTWKDYVYTMKVKRFKTESFSLMSRVESPSDYTACTFSSQYVRIIKTEDSKSVTLANKKLPIALNADNAEVGMSVSGNEVKCYANNRLVLEATLANNELKQGGVAFGVWNPDSYSNPIIVSEIKVREI